MTQERQVRRVKMNLRIPLNRLSIYEFINAKVSLLTIFLLIVCVTYGETPRLRGFTISNKPDYLQDAKATGANVVRFMTGPKVTENPDGSYTLNIDHIKKFIEEADKVGIGVVIDLHKLPNPRSKNYRKDRKGYLADFWDDDSNLTMMIKFWEQIASFCKGRSQIIWYDLLNEPLDWNDFPSYPKKWPQWAQILIDSIRKIDPVHEIVIEAGPGGLCWGFKTFPKLKGDNLIYSTHNYQPHAYTHQGISDLKNTDLAKAYMELNLSWPGEYSDAGGGLWDAGRLEEELTPVIEFQKRHNVRVYIGEFGVIRWAPNADKYLRDNLELFEKYGWDWTYHAFREFHGWSFEHEPVYGEIVKAKNPTAMGKVLSEYLPRNKNKELYSSANPLPMVGDLVQNEYPNHAVAIRCDVTSSDVEMLIDKSTGSSQLGYRSWGKQDETVKRHVYFRKNLKSGYEWEDFSFSFTPERSGIVHLLLSGIYFTMHEKQLPTWTCYDSIMIEGAKTAAIGSFEEINQEGAPVGWRLNRNAKLIDAQGHAADGNRYVMTALENQAICMLVVKAGEKVTVSGKAKRAGRFERGYSKNPPTKQ